MEHYSSLNSVELARPSIVTIGAFDGVHRGHQHLVARLVERADQTGLTAVVLTFHPHPRMLLRGHEPRFYLTLPDQKSALLASLGVKVLVTQAFNEEIRQTQAADFVELLRRRLRMAALCIGPDFALGYGRQGNAEYLRRLGDEQGYEVMVVDPMDVEGEKIGSSRIRMLLAAGEVREVEQLLGRGYSISGTVIEGAGRGRTVGIPTANIRTSDDQAIPRAGVYAAYAVSGNNRHRAVVNIGFRPTFGDSQELTIEAHLLEFEGNLYGGELSLVFFERIRDERKFASVEDLVLQIRADILTAGTFLDAVEVTPESAA